LSRSSIILVLLMVLTGIGCAFVFKFYASPKVLPVHLVVKEYVYPNRLIGTVYIEFSSSTPTGCTYELDVWLKRNAEGYLGKVRGSVFLSYVTGSVTVEFSFDTTDQVAGSEWFWYETYGGSLYIVLRGTIDGKKVDVSEIVGVGRT